MARYRSIVLALALTTVVSPAISSDEFRGIVSSATPEATAAGVAVLDAGGNAVDAAVAVSLALAVTEPAGSGIAGQTVMLVKEAGDDAFVIQGTTYSPHDIPVGVERAQLRYGHTASTVPSTLRVLDLAHRRFGSGNLSWAQLVQPAIDAAENGFIIGPFRQRAFRNYGDDLRQQDVAAAIFVNADGSDYQVGERLRQPLLAKTLQRIADHGALDFYVGDVAREIATDMRANGGWITTEDLSGFPEPQIVPAIKSSYRGYDVETLPPPFGGWAVLQILNVLELSDPGALANDGDERRLQLLDALRIAHRERRANPITEYRDYDAAVTAMTSKKRAAELVDAYRSGGETTHFSVVDGTGMAVAVTQSIDSYFGAKVAHPTLGFLYNNYMQGFQVDDPDAPYYLVENEMPLSSMSATILSIDNEPRLVLGSPGSARIISAVAQVTSHWIDVGAGIESAVAAWRVHVVPDASAYVEGPEVTPQLLAGMAGRGLTLRRPAYGVSDGHLDPYFGGVHALALENAAWTGAADPRRDGLVAVAGELPPGRSQYLFEDWSGPAIDVRLFIPEDTTPDTSIVIVMHGWSRAAQRYFEDWSTLGREHGFIVVVPHFPVQDFPSSNDYNSGHVFDADSGDMRPADQWTFAAIEAVFDDVVARTGSARNRYTLFGHSAGAQFVHRFLFHVADARVDRYIAANAGWYTLPDFSVRYPYGLEDARLDDTNLAAALEKDVVLMLGREDVDRDDPNLRKTPEADLQGPNRYARGLMMFDTAKKAAAALGAEFNWRLVIVEDAAHVNAQMAEAAAALVE